LGGDILMGISSAVLLLASLFFSSLVTGDPYLDIDKVDGFQVFDGLTHGIWEEVFFRGIILALFLRIKPGKWSAFVLAAGLFAIVHFDIYNFLRLFLIGLFWCYMTFESGSLLPAIISHSIFDIFSVALVPSISGNSVYLWLIVWHLLNGIAIVLGILLVRWVIQKMNLGEPSDN
jgi:membrane protease YdiL (CAAX protease family)